MFNLVRAFHIAFDVPAPDKPQTLSWRRQDLRESLIREEWEEYNAAVEAGDLVAIADALADLVYVVLGTAVEHGFTRFEEIFAEVHAANLRKLGPDGRPTYRGDGKVTKPRGWSKPDIAQYIQEAP
jgi:predicted HAD superfamily Cof-like phosphohydrolase